MLAANKISFGLEVEIITWEALLELALKPLGSTVAFSKYVDDVLLAFVDRHKRTSEASLEILPILNIMAVDRETSEHMTGIAPSNVVDCVKVSAS